MPDRRTGPPPKIHSVRGLLHSRSFTADAGATRASVCGHRSNMNYSTPHQRPPESRKAAPPNSGHCEASTNPGWISLRWPTLIGSYNREARWLTPRNPRPSTRRRRRRCCWPRSHARTAVAAARPLDDRKGDATRPSTHALPSSASRQLHPRARLPSWAEAGPCYSRAREIKKRTRQPAAPESGVLGNHTFVVVMKVDTHSAVSLPFPSARARP
jgi:hypothetical protein